MITNKGGSQSMIKLKIIAFSSMLSINYLCAQNELNSKSLNDSTNFFELFNKNILTITQESKIKKIASMYFEQNSKNITVFKIQLNTLNDSRQTAKNDSIKYENIFYPEKVEIVYEAPYFKSKTKHFLQKKDAEKKIQQISKYFKNAFILKEEIDIEEIQKLNY